MHQVVSGRWSRGSRLCCIYSIPGAILVPCLNNALNKRQVHHANTGDVILVCQILLHVLYLSFSMCSSSPVGEHHHHHHHQTPHLLC